MSKEKITSIGGQAVIEGVMMRGPFKTCVSVRKPDGEIITKITENKVKGGFRKIPILRGIFGFVNSMVIGINALMFSAQFYEDDGTPKEEKSDKEENAKVLDEEKNSNSNEKENINKDVNKDINKGSSENKKENESSELSGFALFLTLMTSLALSIGLFFVLPNLIASLIVPNNQGVSGDTAIVQNVVIQSGEVTNEISGNALLKKNESGSQNTIINSAITQNETKNLSGEKVAGITNKTGRRNDVLYNVVESVVKIAIFLGYLFLVSRMKDIKRVFEYHGAEHKTIFCYEHGDELTVENVKKYKRFHPRCGTSFLLFVMIISIIVYSIVGRHPNILLNVLIRIALLPLIAGISYEIIRFAGKHSENKCIAWLNKPGMALQRLTTREPDDSQIECAISSLKAVIPEDEKADIW